MRAKNKKKTEEEEEEEEEKGEEEEPYKPRPANKTDLNVVLLSAILNVSDPNTQEELIWSNSQLLMTANKKS